MEEGLIRSSPRIEDIPELIHRIQLLLPVKEAARTSLLSKSWLYAWSTIPTLRFREASWSVSKELRGELLKAVNNTLIRYLRDNLPIQSIDIDIVIDNTESASFAEKWIRGMATKSCLQELFLEYIIRNKTSFTLPDEILSGKNLSKISVSNSSTHCVHCVQLASHPVINCQYLQELVLEQVCISEEVLDHIFSTCTLLVKIGLYCCEGFKTIKVKNLHCLYEFGMATSLGNMSAELEFNDVPNLRLFRFEARPLLLNLDSLGSVTQLSLGGLTMDDAIVNIIESKFPFLESLTLDLDAWMWETFNFTCVSIKRIFIKFGHHSQNKLVNIKVYAPNLVFFRFHGETMPSLLFPDTNILEEMELYMYVKRPHIVREPFFLKMREALRFTKKCNIEILTTNLKEIMPTDMINVDDLRRRVGLPAAINVQQLSFTTLSENQGLGERSTFFDALFSICHPKHVVAGAFKSKHNYFSQLMVREVLEKKTRKEYWGDYLKSVGIRRHGDERWEILTNSWRNLLVGPAHLRRVEFKLNWR